MDNATLSYFLVAILLLLAAAYILLRNWHLMNETGTRSGAGSVRGAKTETITQMVDMENFAFDPETIDIKPGTLVLWVNKDNFTHNIRSDTFNSPDILSGGSFSSIFELSGTYDYYCGVHPAMKGKIVVKE